MPDIGDSKGTGGAGSFEHKHRDCYRSDGRKKLSFRTKKEAKIAARLNSEDGHYSSVKTVTYRCKTCGMYHNGHARRRR